MNPVSAMTMRGNLLGSMGGGGGGGGGGQGKQQQGSVQQNSGAGGGADSTTKTHSHHRTALDKLDDVVETILRPLIKQFQQGDGAKLSGQLGPKPAARPSVAALLKQLEETRQQLDKLHANTLPESERQNAEKLVNMSTDLTLASLKRMIQMCYEAMDSGIAVISALETQLEQLDNIEDFLDMMNQDMHEAEHDLENLEKCCGLCILPWNKQPNFEDGEEYLSVWQSRRVDNTTVKHPKRCSIPAQHSWQLPKMSASTGATNNSDEREAVIDELIEQLNALTTRLCSMTHDINYEILLQTEQCYSIVNKAHSLEARVELDKNRSYNILDEEEDDPK